MDYKVANTLSRESGGCREVWYPIHAAAYALGNFLIAPGFKDLVLKKLVICFERGDDIPMAVVLDMARTIYNGTSTQDGKEMRLLMAYYTACRFGPRLKGHYCATRTGARTWIADEIRELAEDLPEFIADVMRGLSSCTPFRAVGFQVAMESLHA